MSTLPVSSHYPSIPFIIYGKPKFVNVHLELLIRYPSIEVIIHLTHYLIYLRLRYGKP